MTASRIPASDGSVLAGGPVPEGGAGPADGPTPGRGAAGGADGPPRALLAAQAVGALGMAAGGTAGPLALRSVTGSDALTPLPLGLLVTGAALSAPLVTAVMRRRGRATGLVLSYAVAALGALLVIAGTAAGSAAALLVGSLLLGTGNTAVMLGRYAAADTVPADRTARAIGASMTAVTVGAVCGPALLGPLGSVAGGLALPPETGLYLLAAAAFPAAATLALRPAAGGPAGPARPPAAPAADPDLAAPAGAGAAGRSGGPGVPARRRTRPVRAALLVLGAANLSMVTLMAVAPVHLHGHGWSLDAVGLLVAVHVAMMFGPSPLSGRLCERIGPALTAVLGVVVTILSALLLALPQGGTGWAATGLVLLGLGWNLQLISGTALLVAHATAADRHRAEGTGESVMGAGAAFGTLGLAAPLLAVGGLPLLALAIAVVGAVAAAPLARGTGRGGVG